MTNETERPDLEEIVQNLLIGARTNSWYGDVVRILTSEASLDLPRLTDRLTQQRAAELSREAEEVRIPEDKVESVLSLLTNTGVVEESSDGEYSLTSVTRKYLHELEPSPAS